MKKFGFIYNKLFIPAVKIANPVIKAIFKKYKQREEHVEEHGFDNLSIPDGRTVVWFHAASMGEFEQAKPVIETIKSELSHAFIIVTFFSPSGYNNQKNYKYADVVTYLPFDTKKNAKDFIKVIKPNIAVFIRYDIWYNYLHELKKRNIPAVLLNATLPGSNGRKIISSLYAESYNNFTKIITAGKEHTDYFNSLKLDSEIITLEDTRFDRIIEKVEESVQSPLLPKTLFDDFFTVVLGSSWPKDEEIFASALTRVNNNKIKLIVAPHEPNQKRIGGIIKLLPDSVLLSELIEDWENKEYTKAETAIQKNHIIVDSIGKLLKIYHLADLAYVGGGFGAGVHSVTEPAGHEIPIITGPKIYNSPDALNLSKLNCLNVVHDEDDVALNLSFYYSNFENRKQLGTIAKNYVYSKKGAGAQAAKIIINMLNGHP